LAKKQKYKATAHAKFLCNYHLILVPKFRYKVLQGEIEADIKEIIKQVCEDYDYELIEMECMPDHIHLFIGATLGVAPSDIVRTIKSITAIKLFEKHYALKNFYSRCGSLWSRGKFICTAGILAAETIIKYIQEQKSEQEDIE
jgi:putative transposase